MTSGVDSDEILFEDYGALRRLLSLFLPLAVACASAGPKPSDSPAARPVASSTPVVPAATPESSASAQSSSPEPKLEREDLSPVGVGACASYVLPPAPKELSPIPARCQGARSVATECANDVGLQELAEALELSDVALRDAALARLENCSSFPPGSLRVLRADLWPECVEAIVEPLLLEPSDVSAELMDVARGLAIAGRFNRARVRFKPFSGIQVEQLAHWVKNEFRPWVLRSAELLSRLEPADCAAPARSYARAVIDVARVNALRWLRDIGREQCPLIKDYELRAHYFIAVDEVGSELYAEERRAELAAASSVSAQGLLTFQADVEFVKQLRLAAPQELEPHSAVEHIAVAIPPYYAGLLLADAPLDAPATLAALLTQGLSLPHRRALRERVLSGDSALRIAYFRSVLARRTLDAVHWDELVRLLEKETPVTGVGALYVSMAKTVGSGPRSLSQFFSDGWPRRFWLTPLETLLAKESDSLALSYALNDLAALRLATTAPDTADDIHDLRITLSLLDRAAALNPELAERLASPFAPDAQWIDKRIEFLGSEYANVPP